MGGGSFGGGTLDSHENRNSPAGWDFSFYHVLIQPVGEPGYCEWVMIGVDSCKVNEESIDVVYLSSLI